ncbi:nuclear transport factor 2 family protein [Flagellimonas sp.]|uniref:nuclear transport factor 2 family protein n=1 Tax=Flagellimonas sp. TaxID=2058762 RepID=UPI003BA91878
MTKIISKPNCGNSPKMAFLKEFNSAFVKANVKFLLNNVTDDIVWTIVGNGKIEGKEQFADALEQMTTENISELFLDQILSHGKEGAVRGTMVTRNGKQYAFSDFYEFKRAKGEKIKTMTSYVIKL